MTDEIITTKDVGTRKYLVRWKRKSPTDDSWIDRSKLQKIDPNILEHYESSSSNSTESSYFQPGENGADIMKSSKPPTKLNSKA